MWVLKIIELSFELDFLNLSTKNYFIIILGPNGVSVVYERWPKNSFENEILIKGSFEIAIEKAIVLKKVLNEEIIYIDQLKGEIDAFLFRSLRAENGMMENFWR